jgi:hypothetical protein
VVVIWQCASCTTLLLVSSLQPVHSVVHCSFAVLSVLSTGSMSTARSSHSATLLNTNNVLICAGIQLVALASCELYNATGGVFATTGIVIVFLLAIFFLLL